MCPAASRCMALHCLFKHPAAVRQAAVSVRESSTAVREAKALSEPKAEVTVPVRQLSTAATGAVKAESKLKPEVAAGMKQLMDTGISSPNKKPRLEKADSAHVPSVIPLKSGAPATLQQRRLLVAAIAKALRNQNLSQTPERDASLKEHEIASKTTSATYGNTIRQYIARVNKNKKEFSNIKEFNQITNEQILTKLESLVHSAEALEAAGYMTVLPTEEEIAEARKASENGYETCARCTRHFKIGAQGQAECLFHSGKLVSDSMKYVKYSCCSEPRGLSAGCTTFHQHVYKIQHAPLLAAAIPFKTTTGHGDYPSAVSLDCEMAYTSLGMELIRLTILDFPSHQLLYDSLVLPKGSVIDLNSQFSGVKSLDDPNIPTFEQVRDTVLEKYIGANTILVGHGLENDVSVLRIFHKRYVDSALIFWQGRFKPALKTLVTKHLDRTIQTHGMSTVTDPSAQNEPGHDSLEDAKGAADLIIFHIKRIINTNSPG